MIRLHTILGLGLLLLFTNCSYKKKITAEAIWLSPIYSSGMVIQAQPNCIIHGSASPGGTLAVKIDSYLHLVKVKADGTWKATFPKLNTNKPITIRIEGIDTTIVLSDVIPGKVYFALGNAGMNPLSGCDKEIADKMVATNANIKVLTVDAVLSSSNEIIGKPGSWQDLSSNNISTTSNNLIKEILQEFDPGNSTVGIIDLSVPGSKNSAWLNTKYIPDSIPRLIPYSNNMALNNSLRDTICYLKDEMRNGIDKGAVYLWLNEEQWWNARLPVNLGKRAISTGRQICYLRKKITISERFITSDFTIELGDVLGDAEYYINQHQIYPVPNSSPVKLQITDTLLRNWTNVLAIRFFSPDTAAGIYGNNFRCHNQDSTFYKEIATEWKHNTMLEDKFPEYELHLSDTGVLYDALIVPFISHHADGVIWYDSDSCSLDILSSFTSAHQSHILIAR